jgi:hypothetical protein
MSRLIESTIRGRPCISACLCVMVATLMAVHGHAAAADFNATWDASSGRNLPWVGTHRHRLTLGANDIQREVTDYDVGQR